MPRERLPRSTARNGSRVVSSEFLITLKLSGSSMSAGFDAEVERILRERGIVSAEEVHGIGSKHGLKMKDVAGRMARFNMRGETKRLKVFVSTHPPTDMDMKVAWKRLRSALSITTG